LEAESDAGDLTQVIARLRLLAREIWSLRHRRAAEFEGSETHAEAVISYWKGEFEFWSDIFEDAYDPVQQQISAMIKHQSQYAALCGLEESASNGDRDVSEKPKKKKKAVEVIKKKSVMFKPGDEEQS
jgi:ABC-type cobalt transport system substrate-binding protein